MRILLGLVLIVAACKGGEKAPVAAAGSGSAAPASADAAAAPVSKIAAARCEEPCLFLVDTPLAGVAAAYQAACGKAAADPAFEDCAQAEVVRKCVYAAHGFVFKQTQWKVYEQKAWFTADPAFAPKSLSALEKANVWALDARAKACKQVTVSAPDAARAKAWVDALAAGTPVWPPLVVVDHEVGAGPAFVAYLRKELEPGG